MNSMCAKLASKAQNIGYTRFGGRKEEDSFGQASSKMRLKRTKEEMAEVRRGRLVRSTGTKDRHSKVCTAKGPRERRVRLSADTAIQFYDVQDRLGCDRPSKAIDWLMKAAKATIDALDQLPARNPNAAYQPEQKLQDFENQQQQMNDLYMATQTSCIDFNTHPHDLNSRTRSQTQDSCLSLQSFQKDPILPQHHLSPIESLFSASTPLDFNATWNSNSNSGNGKGSVQQVLNQNQLFSQREPLQSIFSPSIRMPALNYNPPPVTGIGFANDWLSGFWVSPHVQGQEEEQNPFCIKSSSETSVLHYQD